MLLWVHSATGYPISIQHLERMNRLKFTSSGGTLERVLTIP